MRRHRLIEHTADMGIEASAESLEGLFSEAACALREMIWSDLNVTPSKEIPCTISGGDYGELMVNWLNEILYLLEIKRFMPVTFIVERVDPDRLDARISGLTFDPTIHPVQREVKAVTYHRLEVEESSDGWHAIVYVDL